MQAERAYAEEARDLGGRESRQQAGTGRLGDEERENRGRAVGEVGRDGERGNSTSR